MSRKEFYQLRYPADKKRPVYFEDIGHLLKISGVLFQGMRINVLCLMPNAEDDFDPPIWANPSLEEWSEILRISDDPQVYIVDEAGTIKAIHRKVEYAISGAIQQKIWMRDNLMCLYCGRKMGEIQLTIDHFVPLEKGGENSAQNYISSCRACQKAKGCMAPQDYCREHSLDYDGLVAYLAGKCSLFFIQHLNK